MKKELGAVTEVRMGRSRFGPIAVAWSVHRSRPRVVRVFLSEPGMPADRKTNKAYPDATLASCSELDRLTRHIEAFLDGEDIRFGLGIVRLDLCSPLQQRVLRAEHAIPRGRLSTYGRLARHLGVPKGARAVGNCLARNPFPIVIPCHRAIRSNGTLGGFQGGTAMKRALLEMEGIRFDRSGRAVAADLFY